MNNLQIRQMLTRNVALSLATLSFSLLGAAMLGSMGALFGLAAMVGAYSLRKYWKQEEIKTWTTMQQLKLEQLYGKIFLEVRSI